MTDTPTPLRELAQQIANEIDIYADDDAYAGKLHRMARHWRGQILAALSARDEAGAVALPSDDEPCNAACGPGCPNRPPRHQTIQRLGAYGEMALAVTPPADAIRRALTSADLYGVLMDVQNGIDSPGLPSMANHAIRLIDAARAALATPPASGAADDEVLGEVLGWLDGMGGYRYEKIAKLIRRLAAVAPAGMVLSEPERKALAGVMADAEHDAGDVDDIAPRIEDDEDAYWAFHSYHGLRKLLAAVSTPPTQASPESMAWRRGLIEAPALPTREMLEAWEKVHDEEAARLRRTGKHVTDASWLATHRAAYIAMMDAAPTPPATAGQE